MTSRTVDRSANQLEEADMAGARGGGGNMGGIGLGGILVIVGIVVMLLWSFLLGLIITLIGLVAFGGFAKGKWY
jgi:predicted metalloprotease